MKNLHCLLSVPFCGTSLFLQTTLHLFTVQQADFLFKVFFVLLCNFKAFILKETLDFYLQMLRVGF